MARQQVSIPILGIDKRPLKRQATPGLCDDIRNLRPYGIPEEPYWEPVAAAGDLVNNDDVPFDHPKKDQLVDSFWLQTSKYTRFITVFDDGSLDVINPDGASDWQVLTSYSFGSAGPSWGASFAPVAELLAIAITKDGDPHQLLYLFEDTIVKYGFPFLPSMLMEQVVKTFTQDQVDNGNYTGIKDGWYAYRYGFRFANGENISLSPPIPFQVNNPSLDFSEIKFTMGGYSAESVPDSFEFWKDILVGVDVFLSDRHGTKEEVLIDGLYYNVVSFGSIDRQSEFPSTGDDPNVKTFEGKNEDIPTNPLFEVDGGSFHGLAAGTVFSYNSRLMLGNVSEDFVEPPVSIYGLLQGGATLVMSSVEYYSEQQPVQGDPYETYSVYYARFTVTALFGAVLPESEVVLSNVQNVNNHPPSKTQEKDEIVRVTFLIEDESVDPPPPGPLQFTVDAQAKDAMSGGNDVGDPLNFTYDGGA